MICFKYCKVCTNIITDIERGMIVTLTVFLLLHINILFNDSRRFEADNQMVADPYRIQSLCRRVQ